MLRCLIAGVMAGLLAGCTVPPTSTPTPSPSGTSATPSLSPPASTSPTPTPSWDAKQAAGIKAVRDFTAASTKIGANPAKYTQTQMVVLLRTSVGGNMIKANVDAFNHLKKQGYRKLGGIVLASISVNEVANDGDGDSMLVSVCQDQRALRVVDRAGKVVEAEQAKRPPFLFREYTVSKPTGEKSFRVFGMRTGYGECGP